MVDGSGQNWNLISFCGRKSPKTAKKWSKRKIKGVFLMRDAGGKWNGERRRGFFLLKKYYPKCQMPRDEGILWTWWRNKQFLLFVFFLRGGALLVFCRSKIRWRKKEGAGAWCGYTNCGNGDGRRKRGKGFVLYKQNLFDEVKIYPPNCEVRGSLVCWENSFFLFFPETGGGGGYVRQTPIATTDKKERKFYCPC